MKRMTGVIEADRYVRLNATSVSLDEVSGHYAPLLRCIDGRRSSNPERLGREASEPQRGFISFPGGGIGVAALLLSVINVRFIVPWEAKGDGRAQTAHDAFNFGRVINCLERALGGMSCHTDDEALKKPLACAGCGHAMAFLNGGDYGLGKTYQDEMVAYLTELKKRALKGDEDVIVDVYHGRHVESAVLRINSSLSTGRFVSIPPTSGDMSAFVFNEAMSLKVLRDISGLLYEEMLVDFKSHGISKEEFEAHVISLFYTHARESAFKLAHGLPVFDVTNVEGVIGVRASQLKY